VQELAIPLVLVGEEALTPIWGSSSNGAGFLNRMETVAFGRKQPPTGRALASVIVPLVLYGGYIETAISLSD
jgi:hypothetical protein